jgi:hypothetical protein
MTFLRIKQKSEDKKLKLGPINSYLNTRIDLLYIL